MDHAFIIEDFWQKSVQVINKGSMKIRNIELFEVTLFLLCHPLLLRLSAISVAHAVNKSMLSLIRGPRQIDHPRPPLSMVFHKTHNQWVVEIHLFLLLQLNELRATERRKPQVITSVYQPFNPKSFNFTWVKSSEVIFNLRKSHSPSTNGVSNGEEVSEPVNGAVSEVCFTFFI